MHSGQCGEQHLKDVFARLCWVTAALPSGKCLKCELTVGKTGIKEENKVILAIQLQLQSLTWHVAEVLGKLRVYQCCTTETPEIILTLSAVLRKQISFTNFSLIRFITKIFLALVKLE